MISVTIDNLITYLSNNCNANVYLASKDPTPADYPLINVKAIGSGSIEYRSTSANFAVIPITMTIIVDSDNEHKAFDVLDNLLSCINGFEAYRGHSLTGSAVYEYTDNSTYEITIDYLIKLDMQREA